MQQIWQFGLEFLLLHQKNLHILNYLLKGIKQSYKNKLHQENVSKGWQTTSSVGKLKQKYLVIAFYMSKMLKNFQIPMQKLNPIFIIKTMYSRFLEEASSDTEACRMWLYLYNQKTQLKQRKEKQNKKW